jgi:hypothetical protein
MALNSIKESFWSSLKPKGAYLEKDIGIVSFGSNRDFVVICSEEKYRKRLKELEEKLKQKNVYKIKNCEA